ncbi:MAG: S-layer homology domain-containing protein [Clostridia bacterium]|nr:S-layer homology domain-containing protein [Clostridia bacterium]
MKKFISLLVLIAVVLGMGIITVSSDRMVREDIPVMLEEDATAQGLVKLGILKGTGEGLELERNITRAEAVALIFRVHYENIGAIGMPSPEFTDLDNHWAYKEVTAAKKMGIVEGVGGGMFEPDRIVTGREFAKMLMSTLGYKDITIENVYEKALDAQLLTNNFTMAVVVENMTLLRSDAARILWGVFLAKTPDGVMYKDKLIEAGKFTEEDYYGTLYMEEYNFKE